MMNFNSSIGALVLAKIPTNSTNYTWSNMQEAPLLKKLDCFFSSESRTLNYPNTSAINIVKPIFYHVPSIIQVCTNIPKANIFRFETFGYKPRNSKMWLQKIGINMCKMIIVNISNLAQYIKIQMSRSYLWKFWRNRDPLAKKSRIWKVYC